MGGTLMKYQKLGKTDLNASVVSFGTWGLGGGSVWSDLSVTVPQVESLLDAATDLGINYIDTAPVYGTGVSEELLGQALKNGRRDRFLLQTKCSLNWRRDGGNFHYERDGYTVCNDTSARAIRQDVEDSLKRMQTDCIDVLVVHYVCKSWPVEETMGALDQIVRSGKALYVGISNYPAEMAERAIRILRELGTPCLIEQPNYSMLSRWIENGLTDVLRREKVGCIVFAPLQNGLLTGKYLDGIPSDSRIAKDPRYLKASSLTEDVLTKIQALKSVAVERGQKLHQMALQWVLRDPVVTSALIGASRPEQITDNIEALRGPAFTAEELQRIEKILR